MEKMKGMLTASAVALAFGIGSLACSSGSIAGSPPSATVSQSSSKIKLPMDTASGPAYRTVSGKVIKIKGPYYDVEEYTGAVVPIHVSRDTVRLNGNKKPGDSIRAEITQGGHANSFQ